MPVKTSTREVTLYKSGPKVNEVGVDQPDAAIITENDTHLVIKIPKRTYFTGLYMDRGYASPETVVYEKIESCEPGSWKRLRVRVAISWDNTRSKKS